MSGASRLSLVGACVGASVGGVGRAALAAYHLTDARRLGALVLIAAGIGILIGAVAGLSGKPVPGAVIGAVLSLVVYLGNLQVIGLLALLGAGSVPSLLEALALGALAGGIGGAAGQRAATRRLPGQAGRGR